MVSAVRSRPRVRLFAGLLAMLGAVGLASLLLQTDDAVATQGVTDVHVQSPGAVATGRRIPLSSYLAAAASLANDDVTLDWPGASAIGETVISDASITFNQPSQSIVLKGSASVDGKSFSAMLILDWNGSDPMPVISLGLKGSWDMASLNPAWKLDGGQFAISGTVSIATGDQDLNVIPAAKSFYGDRAALGAKIQVSGTMSLANVFPGIGVKAGLTLAVSASMDPDIDALLGTAPLEPADAGAVHFDGSIAATDLSIKAVPGLTSTRFDLSIDLAGEDTDETAETFTAQARGEVTVNDKAVSPLPVVFDVLVSRDGTKTMLDGGVKEGTTWSSPFGVSGIDVSDLRLRVKTETGKPPSLVIAASTSIGGVGVSAEITATDELAVDMSVSEMTVDQMLSFLSQMGLKGSLSSISSEIRSVVIGPTSIHFETEAGAVNAALSTSMSFRNKTASFLLAGSTKAGAGLVAAVRLPSFTLGDLWPGAPRSAAATSLPDGGIVIGSKAVGKSSFEAGGIEDTFLSGMFCGSTTEVGSCDYQVPSGVSLAATVKLDDGIRQTLRQLGPVSNSPLRVVGTLPVFGGSTNMSLTISVPPIVPAAGTSTSEWLRSAEVSVNMTVGNSGLSVKLTGKLNTALPDETEPSKVDLVTFTLDAEVNLGTSGAGVTLRATVGSWKTPFGVDWVDLNGFVLQIDIKFSPTPGVQIGLAASATLKSACAAFGGSNCPPPSTFNVSFAIGVAAGAPVQVDFGMRIYADAITLKDIAAIAKKMGATGIDPSTVPNASLRNVEFAFSTIDAPALCLERGLTVSASIYLDSPKASSGAGKKLDTGVCSTSVLSPKEATAACQADSACFAYLRMQVSKNGIQAVAALGTIDLSPVKITGASVTLLMTPTDSEFTIAGEIKIEGFASAKGSVSITRSGFAFNLSVSDDKPTGNLFTIEGSAGLNAGDSGVFFKLRIFARLPGLNDAIKDSQEAISKLKKFFTGEPLTTTYALRCLELNVDLKTGAKDPISGKVDVSAHFSAIDAATQYEDGKVWSVGWNFDNSVLSNIGGVIESLSGKTAVDEVGCGNLPTLTRMGVSGSSGIQTDAVARFGDRVSIDVRWESTDFSTYVMTVDMADGSPPIVFDPIWRRPGAGIGTSLTTVYNQGAAGYERRSIVAELHIGTASGPVISTATLQLLLSSSDVSDYSISNVSPVKEGGTVTLTANWTDPVPQSSGDQTTSTFRWFLVSRTESSNSTFRTYVPGIVSTYPLGSRRSDTFRLALPDPCVCNLVVIHEVRTGGTRVRGGSTTAIPIDYVRPKIESVSVDGSTASLLVANPSSSAVVKFSDPRTNAAGYELTVNGKAVTATRSGQFLTFSLAPYVKDDAVVPLELRVRSKSDPDAGASDPLRRSVVFRPANSSSAAPETVTLLNGSDASVSVRSTTLFPLTSDDDPTPFSSVGSTGACGAVWWSYDATATGQIEIRTDGSSVMTPRDGGGIGQELSIAVFDESNTSSPVAIIGPDGDRDVTDYPQLLDFHATVHHEYLIAASASDMPVGCTEDLRRSGPVVLTFTPIGVPPVMDNELWPMDPIEPDKGFVLTERLDPVQNAGFETALDDAVSDQFDSIATSAAGFDQCFDDPLDQTVWYTFPEGVGGGAPLMVTARLLGDVQLAVFDAELDGGGNTVSSRLIGCSEDGTPGVDDLSIPAPPVVKFTAEPLAPGHVYVAMFDSNGEQSSLIEPFVTIDGASLLSPIPLEFGASTKTYDNHLSPRFEAVSSLPCSTKSLQHPLWFSWTATSDSPVDIGSSTGGFDLALGIFAVTDDVPIASDALGCSDEGGSAPETIRLNPTAGQRYLILASSASGDGGEFELDITLRGDKAVNGVRNDTFPVHVNLDNRGATSEGGSPSCPEAPNEFASLWYEVSLPRPMDVDIDTIGSSFDTRLVVSNIAEEVGCNDDVSFPSNVTSRVRVDDITPSDFGLPDLYVRVDGFGDLEVGDVRLNVTTRGDDVANAVPLTGVPATGSLSNVGATVEPDEQRGACAYEGDPVGASVWFTWTAPNSRVYTAQADGFDSEVTVFRSVNGRPGPIVGCGEDDAPGFVAVARWSALAGDTFFIQVDGYQNSTGVADLTISDVGGDFDEDGILDADDNCPEISNQEQGDRDEDGVGDFCDVTAIFQQVPGARLVDSRSDGRTVDGKFQAQGRIPAGTSRQVTIGGRGRVPTTARAVVLDLTTSGASSRGRLMVWPGRAADGKCVGPPDGASVDIRPDRTDSDQVIVKMGPKGRVCLFADVATHVVVDAAGFASKGSNYIPTPRTRLVDTRSSGTTADGQFAGAGARAAGSTYTVAVLDRQALGVDPDAAYTVVDVTTLGASKSGVVTAFSCGVRPGHASVVVSSTDTTSSEVVVRMSQDGEICFFTSTRTQLVVDLVGTFGVDPGYATITSARLADTRATGATIDGLNVGSGRLQPGKVLEFQVTGRAGVPIGARTATIDVRALSSESGSLTIYACGKKPRASNLAFDAAGDRVGEFIAPLSLEGRVCITSTGSTHVLVDVVGAS